MADTVWELDVSNGQLLVLTGVAGPLAKIGHRLTIAMTSWRAAVRWDEGQPISVELTADVASLEIQRGEGGVKGLSGPEKALARSNALASLDADRFPHILFRTEKVERIDSGYRLDGTLEIHGTAQDRSVDVRVEEHGGTRRLSCNAAVRQSDFGVKPYSMMMGAVKVVDEVDVSFTAEPSERG